MCYVLAIALLNLRTDDHIRSWVLVEEMVHSWKYESYRFKNAKQTSTLEVVRDLVSLAKRYILCITKDCKNTVLKRREDTSTACRMLERRNYRWCDLWPGVASAWPDDAGIDLVIPKNSKTQCQGLGSLRLGRAKDYGGSVEWLSLLCN